MEPREERWRWKGPGLLEESAARREERMEAGGVATLMPVRRVT